MPDFPPQSPTPSCWRRAVLALLLCPLLAGLWGCSRLRQANPADTVYVTVRHMYLRDRVAVVANRVAEVTNGERLTVIKRIPRFLQVKTPQGAVGWIEDHAVIDQSEFDEFKSLAQQHANQQPVAQAVLYSDLYMHLKPGRKEQRFYLLPPNAKVSLLERASMPRYPDRGVLGLTKPKPAAAPSSPRKARKPSFESQFLPAVPMDDWWLVRDSAGRTGWMLSRDLDVSVPQVVAQYSENERMIGAYVLRTVDDPDSGKPGGKVPEYLTVLTPYRQGLPYDFDQIRVFTWDTHRHRYGTAFRLRDVAGFFPVKVTTGTVDNTGNPVPTFSFQVAAGNGLSLDPVTGKARAAQMETRTYRMEGNLVRQVLPPGAKASAAKTPVVRHRPTHRRRRQRRAH